jgi:multifunctional beta-oxidation protein
MTDEKWDQIQQVHLKGAYSMTKAVWPIFRQQKWGRVINTCSPAGLYGNGGQTNYAAAKMGLVIFSKTLTAEGTKYNIKANTIVPLAASAMTATVMPQEVLKALNPDFIAPLVGVLVARNGPNVGGRIFELGGGFYSEVRWERSRGWIYKTDSSFTPSAVAAHWKDVMDFSNPVQVEMGQDMVPVIEAQKTLGPNQQGPPIDYKGQVVVITGSGNGLGRAYAHQYAKLGANVVINDVVQKNADQVVAECKQLGGDAVAAVCSAEEGDKIIQTAVKKWGTVHVLINNAGILRDKAFVNMTEAMWDQVMAVHLRGTYKCCKAAWPYMQEQKYGRIIVTSSPNGLYGAHGQANYGSAKAALIGFGKSLAIEGKKNNVLVNVIAPRAGTAMTETIWPKEMIDTFKADYLAPVVGYLTSKEVKVTGTVYESFGGFVAQVRWERTAGAVFPNNRIPTPEQIASKWGEITTFDANSTHPSTTQESFMQIMGNFDNIAEGLDVESFIDAEDTAEIKSAKRQPPASVDYVYSARDVMLYNLGIGAHATELDYTYEGADNFGALPTFGVIPQFTTSGAVDLGAIVPNFNPAKLLHGEQYLKVHAPIPTEGTLVNQPYLREVLDKGKAAAVTTVTETRDKSSGKLIFENHSTVFLRGSGGFGGKKSGADRGAATAVNTPPKRAPDAVVEEKTSEDQAAIYRLSGDYNPLHIDPDFAAIGGFKKPILHGLCSMGFAGRHVLKTYGQYSDIKVRFAGTVIPGETLVTEMWKEGDKVIFQTKVKERNAPAISNAAVTLVPKGQLKSKL